ncbi:hypothetical protein DXG01_015202, partial [Tephrocybe rancida]
MDIIITKACNIASRKDWDKGSTGLLSDFQKGIKGSALDILLKRSTVSRPSGDYGN